MKITKKLFCALLILMMFASMLPGTVFAEEKPPQAVEPSNAKLIVPRDASVTMECKNFTGYNYKSFTPVNEDDIVKSEDYEAGRTTYYFKNLENNKEYYFRVSGENYITYAGYEKYSCSKGFTLDITEEMLKPEGKTKTSVDRDLTSNNESNVADVFLNINAQGYLKLDEVGDTYQLVHLRNWEAVQNTMQNVFVEPDYHYTVVNENGEVDNSVVEISDSGMITAKHEGTAIVFVTYDAMNYAQGLGGTFFGAIWPENTGMFVVSVGAEDSGINTGMTINEGKNTDASTQKIALDALDSELDVIYFTGSKGSYTFTPGTSGCRVSVANPTIEETMTISGFKEVSKNSDGSFSVPLVEGRNIVKIFKCGKSEYQVITAKHINYAVNNGESVHAGDTVSIVFDTLYHPCNKLAGVYNMSANAIYTEVDGYEGKLVGGSSNQYQFASNVAAQTVKSVIEKKTQGWFTNYMETAVLTIPEDYEKDTFRISGGMFVVLGYGDPYGSHRGITLTSGKAMNGNANMKEGFMGQLPDIEIPIIIEDAEMIGIEAALKDTQKTYYVGDVLTTDDFTVSSYYSNGKSQTACKFEISPSVLSEGENNVTITYRGKSEDVKVTAVKDEVTSIVVTTAPNKTSYTVGDVFNPNGMVLTATYASGKTAVIYDYSYAPKRTLQESDEEMIVTVGNISAEIPITVLAQSGDKHSNSTVKVYFTLLGDSQHDSDTDGFKHTLKAGNLTTWLDKTVVTVSSGSKVDDVVFKALGENGIPYENESGSYISSIRGLKEFDNGIYSGWMYTINGRHSNKSIEEQTVKNGDRIVMHYTDDYTVEQFEESWGMTSVKKKNDSNPSDSSDFVSTTDTDMKFSDVDRHSYYYDAVEWALGEKITEGTDGTTFSPENICTRGQIATFLYRAAGSPKLSAESFRFTDVAIDSYYYDAVMWAAANGITEGTGLTTFSPNDYCTRSQMMSFLYRYEKATVLDSKTNPFDDIGEDSYYYNAIMWAVENGITKGTSASAFSPDVFCNRAQAVTFLYRALAN